MDNLFQSVVIKSQNYGILSISNNRDDMLNGTNFTFIELHTTDGLDNIVGVPKVVHEFYAGQRSKWWREIVDLHPAQ